MPKNCLTSLKFHIENNVNKILLCEIMHYIIIILLRTRFKIMNSRTLIIILIFLIILCNNYIKIFLK